AARGVRQCVLRRAQAEPAVHGGQPVALRGLHRHAGRGPRLDTGRALAWRFWYDPGMNSIVVGLVSTGCIFAGSLLGLGLQRLLPGHHLSKETQDVVKLSAGTIATLTALVLGLLVSSAKSSFDTVNNGLVQTSVKIITLDRALASYGPETKPA